MATWARRQGSGSVQIWKKQTLGKRRERLPRKLYSFLDGQTDQAVEAWVRDYELRYEQRRFTPDHLLTGALRTNIESWLSHLSSQGLDENTVKYHRLALVDYAVPFFLERESPLRDVATWPGVSVHLLENLLEYGANPSMIRRVNQSLGKFWDWLRDEGLVHSDLRLRKPIRSIANATPLNYTQTPEQMLKRIQLLEDPRLKLWALCGYFMSLRPNEVYGLLKEDFRPGAAALSLESSKAMIGANLYGRLAVYIDRQKNAKGSIKPPKTKESRAWVTCFNESAAREISKIRIELGTEPWFPKGLKYYSDLWAEKWRAFDNKVFTFKDLRRASLYWLGHNTALTPLQVQKHARHKNLSQTMIYLRRPTEEIQMQEIWDLDA